MKHPELNEPEADIAELVRHIEDEHYARGGEAAEEFQDDISVRSQAPTEPISDDVGGDDDAEKGATSKSKGGEGGGKESGKEDIYSISKGHDGRPHDEINPWSRDYLGVPINYFSIGLMLGGSTSILYPVLVVHEGVTSALLEASTSIVTIFWSYKVVFGFLSDCFPIFGYKRKPYIILGWLLCAFFLTVMAQMGTVGNLTSKKLVLMLSLANLGYVMADVAADGFMVWIAHREPIQRRGRMQMLIYSTSKAGQIFINLVILFGFSGPMTNCPGYEDDPNVSCTTDPDIVERSDLSEDHPDTWCYMKCNDATFDWDLGIPAFAWIIASINLISLPFYFLLKENREARKKTGAFIHALWSQLKRKAAWQVILYTMTSHITFGVNNAAKTNANFVWLDLHTFQNQIMILLEKTVFFVGLTVIRKYALHASWRKMILGGSVVVTCFNLLYYLIVFDVLRNPWFYIFTDVSAQFMYTLNFLASVFCMVEVAEPGYEAVTYSLITTASNTVSPLSSVISYQLLAFFPLLNTQESIATDTPEVRREFAALQALTILVNLTSLFALPMLPRQKKETRELVARGETSTFWGAFALLSALIFLVYSTVVTFLTVAAHDVYGCYKIFGGGGCTADESSAPAYVLVISVLLYCYGVNFYHSFWPILRGRDKFSWGMFL